MDIRTDNHDQPTSSASGEQDEIKWGQFLTTALVPAITQREVIKRTLRLIDASEDMGYESVWTLEHHFTPYGLNGNCIDMANFILGRKKKLKVGSAITVAPLYHPVRLAEDVAMLDQLSDGRFMFGVGRGHFYMDFKVFGVDQSKNHLMMPHWLDIMREAWMTGKTSAENEFISFPEVKIYPETFTKPHPPVFVATTSPSTIEWAAKNGFSMLMEINQEDEVLASAVELWERTAEEHGHDPTKAEHSFSALIVVGGQKERDIAKATLREVEKSFDEVIGFGKPEVENLPNYERHFRELDEFIQRRQWETDDRIERTLSVNPVGSADEVAEILQRKIELTGVKRVLCAHEALMETSAIEDQMQRFMEDVAPKVKPVDRYA